LPIVLTLFIAELLFLGITDFNDFGSYISILVGLISSFAVTVIFTELFTDLIKD